MILQKEPYFIGRQDLLDRLLRGLDEGVRVRADDVSGARGMGKSALISEVRKRSANLGADAVVSEVDLGKYEPAAKPGGRGEQTWGQSLRTHNQLVNLAREILGAVNPGSIGRIDDVADTGISEIHQIKNMQVNVYNELSAGSSAKVSGARQNLTVNLDDRTALDTEFVRAIRKAQASLADAIAGCVNEAARSRAVVLLFDNADAVAGQDLGFWLSRIISELDGSVVVLTHEPDSELDLSQGLGESFRLSPFSRDEVAEFLETKLEQPAPEDLVALLHEWSGGVPVALGILVDLMNDPDIRLGRAELENRLSRLPGNAEGRLAGVVTEMVERLEGRLLGKALLAASVPVECDIRLLTALLAGDGVTADEAVDLMRNLAAFSFTEEYDSPLDGVRYLKVHQFIRSGLADRMRKYQPTEQQRLHAVAAEFFFEEVTDPATYGEMFELEEPAQQSVLRKWLYHISNSADRRTAMQQAAKVMFDAFWWWGNYVYFEFCETLADDLDNSMAAPGNGDDYVAFAKAVRRVISNYPYRAKLRQDFDRTYPPAHWDEVSDALLEIRDLVGVTQEPTSGASELECHVNALIEVFLAHAFRYGSPPDRVESRACYDRAEQWFGLGRRSWDVAWVVFERGDLSLEDEDVPRALAEAASAAALLYADAEQKSQDQELIANLHRLRADCAWSGDDFYLAGREYGLAVLHAYLFHGVGGTPDDYTMQFYFEVRGRSIERMLQLWRNGQTEMAVSFGHELHAPFVSARTMDPLSEDELKVICDTGTISELARTLFPRGPELDELSPRATSSEFMRDLRRFRDRVKRTAAEDLTAPTGDG